MSVKQTGLAERVSVNSYFHPLGPKEAVQLKPVRSRTH